MMVLVSTCSHHHFFLEDAQLLCIPVSLISRDSSVWGKAKVCPFCFKRARLRCVFYPDAGTDTGIFLVFFFAISDAM